MNSVVDNRMRAVVIEGAGAAPVVRKIGIPEPGPADVLVRVEACAVCRTDLHIVDGDLTDGVYPITPGHEIVGVVQETGDGVSTLKKGDRVGIPWLGYTCGECFYCRSDRENLCDRARFTGYHRPGGFAEYTIADERYCFRLPHEAPAQDLAPLLCAGLIGYRSLRLAGEGRRIGLYGFGAAAHIVAQVIRHQGRQAFAFTRPGDERGQTFAESLGAVWAGGSDEAPPAELDAAILFAPVGALVPAALRAVRKGGVVVCGGIHMSDIPSFPYRHLWGERVIRSVTNLTRRDGDELLELAARIPIRTHTQPYPLEEALRALDDLREGRVEGAAVLVIGQQCAHSAPSAP